MGGAGVHWPVKTADDSQANDRTRGVKDIGTNFFLVATNNDCCEQAIGILLDNAHHCIFSVPWL